MEVNFLGHIFSENLTSGAYFLWNEFYRHPEKTKAVQVPFFILLLLFYLILLLLFYFRVLLIKFILSNFRSTNINLLFETRNLHSPTIVRGTLHQSTLDLSIIKCTPGSNVFSRTEQKHGCSGFSFQLIKTSTGTFAGEEAIEFQTFQRNRFCNSVQRPVHT